MSLEPDADWRNALNVEVAKPRGGYEDKPPDSCFGPEWVQEPKLDGIRKTFQLGLTKNWLVSRSRHDKLKGVAVASKRPFIASSEDVPWLTGLRIRGAASTMLDGELVADTRESSVGGATFVGHLESAEPDKLKYVAFDVLFLRGQDMRQLPLALRRQALERLVADEIKHPKVEVIPQFPASRALGERWFAAGMEGAILKSVNSQYLPRHGCGWWKWKAETPCDAFVIGFSEAKSGGSPKAGIKPQPNGKIAVLFVAMMKEGKPEKVAHVMHLPEEIAAGVGIKGASSLIGKVVEFTASGFDGRWWGWARFKQFRDDKRPADCVFEEQAGRLKVEQVLTEVEA